MSTDTNLSLSDRVRKSRRETISDSNVSQIREIVELSPHVVCIHDSYGEYDIFFVASRYNVK